MYIVTGACGFIGSNLVRYLNSIGSEVIVADKIKPDRYMNLSGCTISNVIHRDLAFSELMNDDGKIKGVFHLGACSDTMNFSSEVMTKNYDYTKHLVDICIQKDIPLVYASSAAVYGTSQNFSEDEIETPLNLYGLSKALVDQYVRHQLNRYRRARIIGLRYFNVYGKHESHKGRMASFIYQKYNECISKHYVTLFKPGDQKRDFIHVNDVCKVTVAAMNHIMKPFNNFGIYNVGTGQATKFSDIAEIIVNYCIGTRRDEIYKDGLNYIDFPNDLVGRYQDYTCADITKLRTFYKENLMACYYGVPLALQAYKEGK